MKNKVYIFIFFIIFTNYSCDDFFDSVTDVDIDPHESVISVYSLAGNFAEVIEVCPGASAGFIGNEEPIHLTDADIVLKKNDVIISSDFIIAQPEGCLLDFIMLNDFGANYELEVSHPNYDKTTRAVQTMPFPPIVDNANYQELNIYDPLRETDYHSLKINFTDESNTEDYYFIHGYIQNKCCPEDFFSVWTWSNDARLLETVSSQGLIFNDKGIVGQNYELDLSLDATYIDLDVHNLYVRFSKITKDQFLYMRSKKAYQDSDGNPFAEPVTVHSNIENGLGIFGLEAVNMYLVQE